MQIFLYIILLTLLPLTLFC